MATLAAGYVPDASLDGLLVDPIRAALVAIARALAPGGLLILEDPHADRPIRPEPVALRAERHTAQECYRLSFGCEPAGPTTPRDTFIVR